LYSELAVNLKYKSGGEKMDSILIICDKAPFGTNTANEAIRLSAGFAALGDTVDCKLLLINDGVLLLNKNLNSKIIGVDSLEEGIEMIDLTDLSIYAVKEDISLHGLKEEDLIELGTLTLISEQEIPQIIQQTSTTFKI
jgi:sulfur relay (sulfurtransferase) DsrF/TusC family protein